MRGELFCAKKFPPHPLQKTLCHFCLAGSASGRSCKAKMTQKLSTRVRRSPLHKNRLHRQILLFRFVLSNWVPLLACPAVNRKTILLIPAPYYSCDARCVNCHCEERSDEAISHCCDCLGLDALAMRTSSMLYFLWQIGIRPTSAASRNLFQNNSQCMFLRIK